MGPSRAGHKGAPAGADVRRPRPRKDDRVARFAFGWETQRRIALGETDAGQVAMVEALHDEDDGPVALVVQSGAERLAEECDRVLPLRVALRLQGIVGVIQDETVPPLPVADPPTEVASMLPRWSL